MVRVVLPAAAVLSLSLVASGLVRRRAVAVAAGGALAVAYFVVSLGELPRRDHLPQLAAFGGAAAVLLGLALWRDARAGAPRAPLGALAHWRGEVPVWRALLHVAVLLAACFYAAGALGAASLYPFTRVVAAAVLATWAAAVLGGVWALVGTWRAAKAHGRRGRLRPVGWLARAVVVLLWPALAASVAFRAVPDFGEYGPLAFGPSEREQYAIRMLRGGAELEVRGSLGFGVGEDLEAALAAAPAARVVHLDSPGGRIFEGERVAAAIRERGLSTYVGRQCASACVLAFAAGKDRLLGRGAQIGLHRPSGHNATPRALDRTAARMAEVLSARGVDRRFVERGLATASADLWRPSHDEVIAARLATRRARPSDVALSGATPEELQRLPLTLRESAFFQALFEFERPVFDRVVERMREGHQVGLTAAEALDFVDAEIERIVDRDLPRTSDAAAHAFFQTMLEIARELRKEDPAACAAYLDGGVGGAPGDVLVDAEGRALDAVARVLVDARLDPRPTPGEGEVTPQLLRVFEAASEREPAVEIIDVPDAARARPREYCDAVIAVTAEVVRLPPREAGPLVRWMGTR